MADSADIEASGNGQRLGWILSRSECFAWSFKIYAHVLSTSAKIGLSSPATCSEHNLSTPSPHRPCFDGTFLGSEVHFR